MPSSRLFTDLDKLGVGDIFRIQVFSETLTYEKGNYRVVSDAAIIAPTYVVPFVAIPIILLLIILIIVKK